MLEWDLRICVVDYWGVNFDGKVAVSQVLFGIGDLKCSSLDFIWVWAIGPRLLERIVGIVLWRNLSSNLFFFLYFDLCFLYWAWGYGCLHLYCHFWLCFGVLLKIMFGDVVYDVSFSDVALRSSRGDLWWQDAVILEPVPDRGGNFSWVELLVKLVGKLRCCKRTMAKAA